MVMTKKITVAMSHTRRLHHQPIAAETAANAPNNDARRITGPISLVGKLPSVKKATGTKSWWKASFHTGLKATSAPAESINRLSVKINAARSNEGDSRSLAGRMNL